MAIDCICFQFSALHWPIGHNLFQFKLLHRHLFINWLIAAVDGKMVQIYSSVIDSYLCGGRPEHQLRTQPGLQQQVQWFQQLLPQPAHQDIAAGSLYTICGINT